MILKVQLIGMKSIRTLFMHNSCLVGCLHLSIGIMPASVSFLSVHTYRKLLMFPPYIFKIRKLSFCV